jgi:DNA-binding HxlR family transcriptional regulator
MAGIRATDTRGRRHDEDGTSAFDLLRAAMSGSAIGALDEGPQRFGELQHKLAGISPKVLTQTLRRLEDFGFVVRTVFPEVPLHVEYSLTELGHSANVRLAHPRNWALDNITRVRNLNPAGASP